jgi:hypothetical protein
MPSLTSVPFSIRGARAALVALLLLSLGPPILYYRAIVPGLDSARLSTGLLPAPYTFLRLFGFFSLFVPAVLALAVGLSLWRPAAAAPLLRRCVVVVLLFDACYLCYTLVLIAVILIMRAP